MITLTKRQNEIVCNRSFPNFLRASAGTGKTEVLVQKITNLVCENKINLIDFAIITFTNSATFEMQKRLYDELYNRWLIYKEDGNPKANWLRNQIELCAMVQISTIHEFCRNILRDYGAKIGIAPNFTIGSFKQMQEQIITEEVNKQKYKFINNFATHKIVKLLMKFINHIDTKGFIINDLSDFELDIPDNEFFNNFKKEFLQVVITSQNQIETEKELMNSLTTNDLIKKTREILLDNNIAKLVSDKYQYLFIDEFQDVDNNQFNIVNELIKSGTKAFIIGDEKQSIFRFRGADVQNAENMSNDINKLNDSKENLVLNQNFRSDAQLITYINKVFSNEFHYRDNIIKFPNQPLEVPKDKLQNYCKEPFSLKFGSSINNIVNNLLLYEKIGNKNISLDGIVILCRTNYEVDKTAKILKRYNMPIEVIGGKGFYKTKEILDIYRLLNAVIYRRKDTKYELYFTDYYKSVQNSNSGLNIDELIEQTSVVLCESTVENALHFIFEKSCILNYYRSQNKVQSVANLLKLKEIARQTMNEKWLQPIDFLDNLSVCIKSKKDEDEATIPNEERQTGIITISTIHKAKGTSFPVVILPYADRNLLSKRNEPDFILDYDISHKIKLGFKNTLLDRFLKEEDLEYSKLLENEIIKNLEEELRVFYVAMTRAKHKIILSCNNSTDKVINQLNDGNISWIKWVKEVFDFEVKI